MYENVSSIRIIKAESPAAILSSSRRLKYCGFSIAQNNYVDKSTYKNKYPYKIKNAKDQSDISGGGYFTIETGQKMLITTEQIDLLQQCFYFSAAHRNYFISDDHRIIFNAVDLIQVNDVGVVCSEKTGYG